MDFQCARSDEQREMRRDRIPAVTSEMLEEMPVAKVSLNELSRRVGLAKSNVLLRYFESREAVLLQLLDAELHEWAAQVDALLVESPADRPERITQVADVVASSIAERPVMCDLISAQSAVLERNISTEVAVRHKYAIAGEVETITRAMVRALPELSDEQVRVAVVSPSCSPPEPGRSPGRRPPSRLHTTWNRNSPRVSWTSPKLFAI